MKTIRTKYPTVYEQLQQIEEEKYLRNHARYARLREELKGYDPSPQMKCVCGHKGGDRFFHVDGLGFDLPAGEMRCPECGYRWRKLGGGRIEQVIEQI